MAVKKKSASKPSPRKLKTSGKSVSAKKAAPPHKSQSKKAKKVTPSPRIKPAIKKAEKKKVEEKKPDLKKKAAVKATPQAAVKVNPHVPVKATPHVPVKATPHVPVKATSQAPVATRTALPKVSVPAKEPVIKKSGMPGAVITKIIEKRDRPLEQEKIDEVRQAIITILWKKENILADDLKRETSKEVSFGTDSEFSHYFRHVIEILTKYRLIEEVPDRRPLHLRLAQKLDS